MLYALVYNISIPGGTRLFRFKLALGRIIPPTGSKGIYFHQEVDLKHQYGAEVINAWKYTAIFPIRLHGLVLNTAQRET